MEMTRLKHPPHETAAQLRHAADGLRPRLIPAFDALAGIQQTGLVSRRMQDVSD
jgi:hypothetical protein